jgi:CheY-like chemotaxis protein
MMANPVTVAVFDTNDDIVEMLRMVLENAGFVVVSAHVDDVRRGATNLADFIDEHDPRVILFDLMPPYDRSWRFVEHLKSAQWMKHRSFVLTSTNAKRAEELSGGATDIHEILGKPYDLDEVVRAVQRAAGVDPTLPPGARRV